jgi:hypothetical protein
VQRGRVVPPGSRVVPGGGRGQTTLGHDPGVERIILRLDRDLFRGGQVLFAASDVAGPQRHLRQPQLGIARLRRRRAAVGLRFVQQGRIKWLRVFDVQPHQGLAIQQAGLPQVARFLAIANLKVVGPERQQGRARRLTPAEELGQRHPMNEAVRRQLRALQCGRDPRPKALAAELLAADLRAAQKNDRRRHLGQLREFPAQVGRRTEHERPNGVGQTALPNLAHDEFAHDDAVKDGESHVAGARRAPQILDQAFQFLGLF